MYPTNYMNPMNNQPMSPDYGYNRMQQVQQMQQAINPTVPNMFGQMNQMNNMNQQQQTPYISAIPVTCLDEAKAARISLDGTLSVFINIQDGEIYTKQLNMNGLAELKTYKLVNPQENKIEYVTSNDFNGLNQRVQNIENFLNQLQAAQLQLGNLSQTQNIINAVRPFPQPAYITCSPYTSVNGFGCGNGCGIV